jgi:hypothetical protein
MPCIRGKISPNPKLSKMMEKIISTLVKDAAFHSIFNI